MLRYVTIFGKIGESKGRKMAGPMYDAGM